MPPRCLYRAARGIACFSVLIASVAAFGGDSALIEPQFGGVLPLNPWANDDASNNDLYPYLATDGNSTAVLVRRTDVHQVTEPFQPTSIWVTHDKGVTWEAAAAPANDLSEEEGYAVATDGAGAWVVVTSEAVYRSADNAVTWTRVDSPIDFDRLEFPLYLAVANCEASAAGAFLFVWGAVSEHSNLPANTSGSHQKVYYYQARSIDGGATWQTSDLWERAHNQVGRRAYNGSWFIGPQDKALALAADGGGTWVGYDRGHVARSTDDGQSWSTAALTTTRSSYWVFYLGGTKWMIVYYGTLDEDDTGTYFIVSEDSGQTWSSQAAIPVAAGFYPYTAQATGPDSVEVYGEHTTWYTANGGMTWQSRALNAKAFADEAIFDTEVAPVVFSDRWLAVNLTPGVDGEEAGSDTDLYGRVSTDMGGTWSAPTILLDIAYADSGVFDIGARPLALPNGDVLVAWTTNQSANPAMYDDADIVVHRFDADLNPVWTAPAYVNIDGMTDDAQDFTPYLFGGLDGAIRAFWSSQSLNLDHIHYNQPRTLYTALSSDGGESWSAPDPVAELAIPRESTLRNAVESSPDHWFLLAGDPRERVYLNAAPRVYEKAAESSLWEPVFLQSLLGVKGNTAEIGSAAMASDGDGTIAIAGVADNPVTEIPGLFVASSTNDGVTWNHTAPAMPEELAGFYIAHMSMAQAPNGAFLLVFAATKNVHFTDSLAPDVAPDMMVLYQALSADGTFTDAAVSRIPGWSRTNSLAYRNLIPRELSLARTDNALYLFGWLWNEWDPSVPNDSLKGLESVDLADEPGRNFFLLRSYFNGASWREVDMSSFPEMMNEDCPPPALTSATRGFFVVSGDLDTDFSRDDDVLGSVAAFPPAEEDLDGSGALDAVDIQLIVNALLGEGGAYDVNGDGIMDAADLQSVINAVLTTS